MVLSPRYCRTEPGPSHRGQEGQQEPFAAAFVVLPYPSPGRGITASRWRFGMVSRCSAYGAQGQPGTVGREGDKSVEAVPRPWLTFNLAQMHRGMDKIGPRSAGYPFPRVFSISAAQKALSNSTYWGFSLFGTANPISRLCRRQARHEGTVFCYRSQCVLGINLAALRAAPLARSACACGAAALLPPPLPPT